MMMINDDDDDDDNDDDNDEINLFLSPLFCSCLHVNDSSLPLSLSLSLFVVFSSSFGSSHHSWFCLSPPPRACNYWLCFSFVLLLKFLQNWNKKKTWRNYWLSLRATLRAMLSHNKKH